MLIDLQVKRWFTQLVCSYRLCWISVVRANSWCSIFQLLYYPLSHMAYRNSTRSFSSRGDEFCDWKSAVHGRQKAELDNQGLSCPGIVQIPQLPRTSAIFYFVVIRQCIRRRGIGKWQRKILKKASVKRLQEKIEGWEIQIIVFSESLTLLTQNLLRYSKWVERQNQNVQNSLKADSVASSSSTDPAWER